MKIAFVSASVSRKAGGLHESVRRLAQSVTDASVSVSAFGLVDEYTAADAHAWAPLKVDAFSVRGPREFGFAPGLRTGLMHADVDVTMSHGLWMYPSFAVHSWHQQTGRPYIVHPHGMLDRWAVRNSRWKKVVAAALYENSHLRDAACVRALCEAEAESIRAFGLKNPVCIIPNGVDVPSICDTSVVTQHSPWFGVIRAETKVLLYLGRIHPKKGLLPLLAAWANFQPNRIIAQRWALAIAGWDQGGHEAELKRKASELSIDWSDVRETRDATREPGRQPSLLFLGPQYGDSKGLCYRSCDAYVLPSLSEGLPMTILEAWAHCKPVLMTRECNLKEGFACNAAIQIASLGDDQTIESQGAKIAVALADLVSLDDTERTRIGTNGRALVKANFSWRRIAAEMKTVCKWVFGGGPEPIGIQRA